MYQIIILFFIFQILVLIILFYKDIVKYNLNFILLKKRLFDNYKESDVLLHGVSCGEIQLLKSIINILEKKKISYLITSYTPTGYFLGKKFTKNIYLKPYESFLTSFYLFYKIKPKKLIISESDSWPTYLIISKLFGIEIIYINYTIKYNKPFRNLYHNIFGSRFYLKFKQPIPFYLKNKYENLGNIKFLNYEVNNYNFKKNIVIFASAHCNELETHKKLFKLLSNYTILYVPRQINWYKIFKNKMNHFEINYCENYDDVLENKINVFWKIGCLTYLYKYSKVTIMGGTFNNTGGHNIIEPIINNNLVLLGPSTHTIKDLLSIFKTFTINEKNLLNVIQNIDNNVLKNNFLLFQKYKRKTENKIKKINFKI